MFFHLDAWEYFGLFHPLCQPFLKFGLSPTLFLFLDPLAYLATGCTVYTPSRTPPISTATVFLDITHEVTTPGCFNIQVGGHFQAAPSSDD